ncbi:recombinase family protein [Salinibacterium sp. ZJ450]|uniref:recombinase family protein n=1 Tax=Salinibacterium sp. ZJ450 TaxID=2708338 RepID=UPI00351D7B69
MRVLNLGDLDPRSPLSRVLLQVLGAVAELERSLIRERTVSGMRAAKQRGARIGRPASLTPEQLKAVLAMRATGQSAAATARAFGVSERTIRRVSEAAS